MYFKRIDIQGFKSFAEPVTIEFHEGITCIVGPNGSGKSNISDAVRWVLGEQSAKMLRGGKMEEVIFAGTASRKSRGMAEVTLTIDNNSGILPIDYTEVAITRRMYRSGESGYFINKAPCRLRDIRELIMDTGIGVDGYSIIGQGRIADILSDKPEARREIFEEAAGIVKYRSKKEESERKLETSKLNLDRVDDIIGEIEGRIDGLKEDSIKATEYIKLQERYKNVEINITLKNIENLELKNEYIKDDIVQLNNSVDEGKAEKENIDKEVSEKEARSKELEIHDGQNRDSLLKVIQEINDLSNRSQVNTEKLSSLIKDEDRINHEINAFDIRIEKEKNNADEITQSLKKIDSDYRSMKENFEEKVKVLQELEGEVEALSIRIDKEKSNIYESYSHNAGKKSEIKSLISLKETLGQRQDLIVAENQSDRSAQSSFEFKYADALKESNEKKLLLEKIKQEITHLKDSYDSNLLNEKRIAKDLEDKRIKIGQLAARLKVIEEMEDAYEGYNEAVKFVMRSNLKGMHGVIADLIQVPAGFEKAVETALGAAIQNIVCDSDKDAQGAIDLLKTNRVGRLTFLPLDSIRTGTLPETKSYINQKGFKGLGVQCIEFDNKYVRIMEYLLGRVIIVEKLEDAIKMSKSKGTGGLRFVSLDGDVVNASGAITGGAYRNKTYGLLERKTEAKTLSDSLLNLRAENSRLNEQLDNFSKKVEDEKQKIERLTEKQKETEISLIGTENDIARLKSSLSDIENIKLKRDRELSSIEKEKVSAEMMIAKLQEMVSTEEGSISSAELAVQTATEEKEEKNRMLEEAKEELTQIRLHTNSAAGEKERAEETLKRIKDYINEYQREIDDRKDTLKALKDEKDLLNDYNEENYKLLAEKEKIKTRLEEENLELSQEKILLLRQLGEIREKRESLNVIINQWQSDKHEIELKLAKNETQIEGYKEKLWEDFEVSYIQAMDFQKRDFVMSSAMKENREIRNRIKELGEINLGSIREYESVKERYDFLTEQRGDLLEAMDSLVGIIEDMDRNIKKNFKESFDQVVTNFEQTFNSLFGGGLAELRLADESRPLETGIDIIVQPPGKKLQNINLLSGGEKTLTAIALMFAVLKTKPTPFCILDEVEAALDEANIDRFARYLRDFKEIQFVLVTHQKATMEYADVLYGVTMPEGGISKIISLKMGDAIDLN